MPREGRGSNFVLKLDDRTLPSGYPDDDAAGAGAARDARQGAALPLRRVDPPRGRPRPGRSRCSSRAPPRCARSGSRGSTLLLEELAKGPADPAPVLRRRRRGRGAGRPARDAPSRSRSRKPGGRATATSSRSRPRCSGAAVRRRSRSAARAAGRQVTPWRSSPRCCRRSTRARRSVEAKPGDGGRAAAVERPAVHALVAGSGAARHRGRRPARAARGRRPSRRRPSSSRTSCRRSASSPASRRFRRATSRSCAAILDEHAHLQNVRLHLVGHADDAAAVARARAASSATTRASRASAPARSRSSSRRRSRFRRRRSPSSGPATRSRSPRTPPPRAGRRTGASRSRSGTTRSRRSSGSRRSSSPRRSSASRSAGRRRSASCATSEGHARRARVRNLVAPLHYDDETVEVPEEFVAPGRSRRSHNLRDKQNVTVKFIGYTDDAPLTGRDGAHLRRPSRAVEGAGAPRRAGGAGRARPADRGDRQRRPRRDAAGRLERDRAGPRAEPSRRGRVLVRRSAAGAAGRAAALSRTTAGDEMVTKVYDPPWGRIASLAARERRADRFRRATRDALRRALADVADKTNVRLRFVGYTKNERLDRRTALGVRRRHRPLRRARAPRDGEDQGRDRALGGARPSTRDAATSSPTTS